MGYTAHQVLINGMSDTGIGIFLHGISTGVMIYRNISAHGFSDQLLRIVNGIGSRSVQYLLAIETGHFHISVTGQNDAVCFSNFSRCQSILYTA